MSKFLKIFLFLSISLSSAHASVLQDAARAAGDEASFEVSPESIWAMQVVAAPGNEAEVAILSTEITEILEYDCHYHGTHMACHEGGHHHKALKELSELNTVGDLALTRLEKTLSRRGLSLANLDSFKIWKLEESEKADHDDHGHEDFWLRAVVQGNSYIQQCHIHAGETEYSCHYKSEADVEEEPQF